MHDFLKNNPFAGDGDDKYREYAKDYIKELLTNIRNAEEQLRRSLALVISLAFVFFLARANPSISVTVLSLRLDDLSPLLVAIPLVTAYQFGNIAANAFDQRMFSDKLGETVLAVFPKLAVERWDHALLPGATVLYGANSRRSESLGFGGGALDIAVRLLRHLIVLLGTASLAVVEVLQYGATIGWGASFWVVAALSLLLMLPGIALQMALVRE